MRPGEYLGLSTSDIPMTCHGLGFEDCDDGGRRTLSLLTTGPNARVYNYATQTQIPCPVLLQIRSSAWRRLLFP